MKIEMKITYDFIDSIASCYVDAVPDFSCSFGKFILFKLSTRPYLIVFEPQEKFNRIVTNMEKFERKHFRMFNEMDKL